jgi:hypothetical protein
MTPSQNSKYWHRWSAVCQANRWSQSKGRLVENAVQDASQHHVAVWRIAENLALQDCRCVTANDLRHACHVYAFGRYIGHDSLTNTQFSRLLVLWGDERGICGLLIDPDQIDAQTFWDHQDLAKKESLIRSISALAKEEYIKKITDSIWGTIYWQDLDATALLGLLRKLKGNRPTNPAAYENSDPFHRLSLRRQISRLQQQK